MNCAGFEIGGTLIGLYGITYSIEIRSKYIDWRFVKPIKIILNRQSTYQLIIDLVYSLCYFYWIDY